MATERPKYDEMTETELHDELLRRDWNISNTAISSYGVTLTFRKHYTSCAPGVETRTVSGKDDAEVMRRFRAELDEEQPG